MTIRTRVEKLEAKDPSRNLLRKVILLFPNDPEPIDGSGCHQPDGYGSPIYIRIEGVTPIAAPIGNA